VCIHWEDYRWIQIVPKLPVLFDLPLTSMLTLALYSVSVTFCSCDGYPGAQLLSVLYAELSSLGYQ